MVDEIQEEMFENLPEAILLLTWALLSFTLMDCFGLLVWREENTRRLDLNCWVKNSSSLWYILRRSAVVLLLISSCSWSQPKSPRINMVDPLEDDIIKILNPFLPSVV